MKGSRGTQPHTKSDILLLIYFLEGLMKGSRGTQPHTKSDNLVSLQKNLMKGINQRCRWKLEPRF